MHANRNFEDGIRFAAKTVAEMTEVLQDRIVSDGDDCQAVPYGYDIAADRDGLLSGLGQERWKMDGVPMDADSTARTLELCIAVAGEMEMLSAVEGIDDAGRERMLSEAARGIVSAVLARDRDLSPVGEEFRKAAARVLERDALDIGYDGDGHCLFAWFKVKPAEPEASFSPAP